METIQLFIETPEKLIDNQRSLKTLQKSQKTFVGFKKMDFEFLINCRVFVLNWKPYKCIFYRNLLKV
jgi:hypothetical protein